jgi:hypothetical protein
MFNVGDVVCIGNQKYTIVDIGNNNLVAVQPENSSQIFRWHEQSMFELHTRGTPPTPKLTGMTQFFKDKEIKA